MGGYEDKHEAGDEGMRVISNISSLRELYLGKVKIKIDRNGIGADGIRFLSRLSQL
jgi:hypothetical protein